MTQQEWIEILSLYQKWNWSDWVIFIVSAVSPFIMVVSVIIAWKATKNAKESTELNLKMYQNQKDELEKSFLPIFEVIGLTQYSDGVLFTLINKNKHPIVVTNSGIQEPALITESKYISEKETQYRIKRDGFKEESHFKMWIYYQTLNHRFYFSEITFRIIDKKLVIQDYKIRERN